MCAHGQCARVKVLRKRALLTGPMGSLRKHWACADQLYLFRIAKRVAEQQVYYSRTCGVDASALHFWPILIEVDTFSMSVACD